MPGTRPGMTTERAAYLLQRAHAALVHVLAVLEEVEQLVAPGEIIGEVEARGVALVGGAFGERERVGRALDERLGHCVHRGVKLPRRHCRIDDARRRQLLA